MKHLKLSKIFLLIVIASFGAILFPQNAKADYCEPYYNSSGYYMGIDYVEIGDMSNSSGWEYPPGYSFYSTKTANMKPDEVVDFYLEFNTIYHQYIAIFVDWNADGKFDSDTELAYGSGSSYYLDYFSGTFKVPSNAVIGTTRIRVMTEYWGYSQPKDACGYYSYGECEDYVANIAPNSPDASISAVTSPTKPFRVGDHSIIATLKSGNKAPLKNVKIDWYIDNVQQGTYNWTGTLNENQTANLTFGTVNLDYPDGSTYSPFNIKFITHDANGFQPDADPGNDMYQVNLAPILNDAGVVGFFGPPEGFGPGVTPVRVRIRNYAPKPLTSVTINWKIDNVAQTPVNLTGINILRNQTQDIVIGTYNFYAKTPLGPFTVECSSSNPNGVTDEDQSNDKYNGGIGPSLAAGTYIIGSGLAHFASPSEAASYINSSGVFGNGTVTFLIKPGTYNGQIVLNSPLPRQNPIEFIGNSQYPGDIVISANPTPQNNFVIFLDGMTDVSFNNLTISNNNTNSSGAGILIDSRNVNGLDFSGVNLMGVANSPRYNVQYANVSLLNSTGISVHNSTFNNGGVGLYSVVTNQVMPYINVSHNDFYNFSWLGIYNLVLDGITVGGVDISNNRFISNSGLAPVGGIASWNSTTIMDNEFSGIVGTGGANEAVIYVVHSTENPGQTAEIVSNRINSATNVNGIYIDGANTFVANNYAYVSQTGNYGLSVFRAMNATGAVGNNQFIGSSMTAVNLSNSNDLNLFYNSIASESNTYPTVIANGSGMIWRNIIFNKGTGPALQVGSITSSNENVFYTNGNVLISDNGVNYSDLTSWQAKGYDKQSSIALIEFESFTNLLIKYYSPSLLMNYPLFADDNGYAGMIESNDFLGTPRRSYFAGSHELNLTIKIERQTEGFVDCAGSSDNILTVSSGIDYNAPMTYQWEHDGVAIPGETEPIIYFRNLRHNQSGLYKCLVMGPGATSPLYSEAVAVYVTRPTDITREPESHGVMVGSTATLMVDAHVNGVDLETALANGAVQVQWYRYVDEANDIPLVDNKWVSGSKSNYLTINKFRSSDVGTYYAVIIGLCGTVKTAKADLTEESNEVVIEQQPIDNADCAGKDVIFNVNASTPGTKLINYQWYKDGNAIIDNLPKIEGSKSKHLIIYSINAADEGQYYAVASLEGTTITKQSDLVTLNVNTKPVISEQPLDATVESGKQLMLSVTAQGNDASEVLTYKWYKDGALVSTLTVPDYIVDVTTPDDAGDYYVVISNDCGAVTSLMAAVVITTGTTDVIEVSKNGYSLSTAMPNPVQGNSVISFNVPVESYVKITLSDVSGAAHTVLTEGNFAVGTHHINLDAQAKNLVSSTYFYILEANGIRLTQKLVVIR